MLNFCLSGRKRFTRSTIDYHWGCRVRKLCSFDPSLRSTKFLFLRCQYLLLARCRQSYIFGKKLNITQANDITTLISSIIMFSVNSVYSIENGKCTTTPYRNIRRIWHLQGFFKFYNGYLWKMHLEANTNNQYISRKNNTTQSPRKCLNILMFLQCALQKTYNCQWWK